jgi:hypothetical protein
LGRIRHGLNDDLAPQAIENLLLDGDLPAALGRPLTVAFDDFIHRDLPGAVFDLRVGGRKIYPSRLEILAAQKDRLVAGMNQPFSLLSILGLQAFPLPCFIVVEVERAAAVAVAFRAFSWNSFQISVWKPGHFVEVG